MLMPGHTLAKVHTVTVIEQFNYMNTVYFRKVPVE